MILAFTLISKNPVNLPLSYNYFVQSMFYKLLYEKVPWLHDKGFEYMKRNFRLFTFSKIFSREFKIKKTDIIFNSPIKIFFSSPMKKITNELANSVLKNDKLFIGRNELFISEVVAISKNTENDEVIVKTLSPITVYRTSKDKKTIYYTPDQKEFQELINQNLYKKAQILGVPFSENLSIEPIDCKKRATNYKNFFIQCWEGKFKLKGNREIINIAFETGIGAKNSQGFGMIVSEDFKIWNSIRI